jgi:tetratricopeptide (TPR) repeat protein
VRARERAAALAATLLLLAASPLPARASDEARALLLRAEELASQDRCEEALPRARRAAELAPQEARAALVEGRCALRLGRYGEAIAPLERARRLDPALRGVALDLAIAHYHQGQLAAADLELKTAERESPDDARVVLYRGLLLLRSADSAEAAATLERAGGLDAEIDPAASYYAGLAWEYARDRERARQALERVQRDAPDSEWAREAGLALERMAPAARRHWWADLQAGMEYDSNVVLRGAGVALPSEIARKEDVRGVWDASAGAEFWRTEDWSAGARLGYSGSAYIDLDQFDFESPSAALWLDRRVDEHSFVRLRPFYAYSWRDGHDYLQSFGGEAAYFRDFEQAGSGRAFALLTQQDFRFPEPDDPDVVAYFVNALRASQPQLALRLAALDQYLKGVRDRDGLDSLVGYEHSLEVADGTTLRGGLAYRRYDSDGREWRYQGGRGWIGLRQDLPLDFTLDLLGSYEYEAFQHRSTFPPFGNTSARADHVWNAQALLERPITSYLKASVRYRYTKDASNTPVFRYDRHMVGAYLTFSFGS